MKVVILFELCVWVNVVNLALLKMMNLYSPIFDSPGDISHILILFIIGLAGRFTQISH